MLDCIKDFASVFITDINTGKVKKILLICDKITPELQKIENDYNKNPAKYGGFEFNLDEKVEETEEYNEVSKKFAELVEFRLFPADTIYTLRELISIHTNIPPLMQHIKINGRSDYEIYIDNDEYKVLPVDDNYLLYGIKLDQTLISRKSSVMIEYVNHQNILNKLYAERSSNIAIVYDLQDLISQITTTDSSDIEMIYHGKVKKYFPQFSEIVFKKLLNSDITTEYPEFYWDHVETRSKLEEERKLLFSNNEVDLNYCNHKATFINYSSSKVKNDVQELFNNFELNETFGYMCLNNGKNMIKKSNNEYLMRNEIENSCMFYWICNKIHIKFYFMSDFKYQIDVHNKSKIRVNLGEVVEIIQDQLNELIKQVNSYKNKSLFDMNYCEFNKQNVRVLSTSALFYHKIKLSDNDFYSTLDLFKRYERAGILIVNSNSNNVINLALIKGASENVDANYLYEFYKKSNQMEGYFTVANLKDTIHKYAINKMIRIENIFNQVQIEVVNLNQLEYDNTYPIVQNIAYNMNAYQVEGTNSKNISKASIKKLLFLDPALYNAWDEEAYYSRICQKEVRPLAYEIGEINENDPYVFKWKNMTTGEDILYKCNEKYPYLNFIPNKHPDNFCIPKCSETVTQGKKRTLVYNLCMTKYLVTPEDINFKESEKIFIPTKKNCKKKYLPDPLYMMFCDINKDDFISHQMTSETYNKIESPVFSLLMELKKGEFDNFDNRMKKYFESKEDYHNELNWIESNKFSSLDWDEIATDIFKYYFDTSILILDTRSETNQFKYDNYLFKNKKFIILIKESDTTRIAKYQNMIYMPEIIMNTVFKNIVVYPDKFLDEFKIEKLSKKYKIKKYFSFYEKCIYVYADKMLLPCIGTNMGEQEYPNRLKYRTKYLDVMKLIKKYEKNEVFEYIVLADWTHEKFSLIGIQIRDLKFWFENTDIRKIPKNSIIKYLNEEPHIINNLIMNKKITYSHNTKGYYDKFIYKSLLNILFQDIMNHRNKKIRKKMEDGTFTSQDLKDYYINECPIMSKIPNIKSNIISQNFYINDLKNYISGAMTFFNFDLKYMYNLSQDKNNRDKIQKIIESKIKLVSSLKNKKFENEFSISNNDIMYEDGKLIVLKSSYKKFLDRLSQDYSRFVSFYKKFLNYKDNEIIDELVFKHNPSEDIELIDDV